MCKEGYGGILCANCVGRYRRSEKFVCTECASPKLNIFISALYFISLCAAVIMLVMTTMRGSSQRKPLVSVYMKIFLNHFQILQAISTIKFGWPDMIQEIMNYQQYISSLPTEIISFDCLMIDYVTGDDPNVRFNYLRLFTFYLLPIAVILLSFLFWGIKGCCKRLSG